MSGSPVPPDHASGDVPREWSAFDALACGVWIVDGDGRARFLNAAARRLAPAAQAAILAHLAAAARELASDPRSHGSSGRQVSAGDAGTFDVRVAPMPDAPASGGCVIAVVVDVSAERRLLDRLTAVDAAGRELIRFDPDAAGRLEVGERLRLLEDRILYYGRDLLHFDHVVIRVLDRRANRLDTVIAGGVSEAAKALELYATTDGGGISGYVAATGVSYICRDVASDPRYLPGLETARSSLTVPLRLGDQVVGTLNVESERPAAFDDDDRSLAEAFGRYVASSLNLLQLLAAERYAAAGQIAADVRADLAPPLEQAAAGLHKALREAGVALRPTLEAVLADVTRVHDAVAALSQRPAIARLASAPPAARRELEGRRVLVADDEDVIRDTVADVLRDHGAMTVRARDGEEAIGYLRAQPFDLVLSDIKMPHKNGYEVFAAARQAQPDCPVLLITGFGYDPEHAIVRAGREGLAGVLFKPFKVEHLLEEVRRALKLTV